MKKDKIIELNKRFKNTINVAKEKDLIKPLSEAFKDVPVKYEIHNGRKEYFY